MKKSCFLICVLSLLMISQSVFAQAAPEGVDSFKQDKNAWRRKEVEVKESGEITQKIKDGIASFGLNNIINSEQVFCYNVEKASKEYTGYTIDGMAITGFCGILPKKDTDLFIKEFLTKDANTSNVVAQCVIEPKIMLRFVKGVDNTDILLSSPCHSFSVFYGGKVKSFNAQPAAKIVEAFVSVYGKRKVDFVSPALLNQVMPIGVAKTSEQKALVKAQSGKAPIKKWEQKTPQTQPEEPQNNKVKKGWNKLKK